MSELYSREINGVVTRVNECTVYRRKKRIKELLYNSREPIRDAKLKKIAEEYCEKEGLKTLEKDGGLMLCDFSETFSNDSTVSIEISSEDRRPMETSKQWNDLDITECNKEMDAVEEETPPIVEPTGRSGESGSLNMD